MKRNLIKLLKLPLNIYRIFKGNMFLIKNQEKFHDGIEKNILEIIIDLFKWSIKYGEVNVYYYQYGFNIKGKSQSGYISKTKYMHLRERSNTYYSGNRPMQYICMLSDKIEFSLLMNSKVDIPETKFYIRNNMINDIEHLNINNLKKHILIAKKFIIKDSFGQEAGTIGVETDGVLLVEFVDDILTINGKSTSINDFLNIIQKKSEWIAQELIIQHPMIKLLNESSVNTVRFLTYIDKNNNVKIAKAVLKIGAKGQIVDNFWAGGILLNIDVENGQFTNDVLFNHKIREKHEVEKLVNYLPKEVINWDCIIREAKKAHSLTPKIRSIGWDIAITEEGACIIEGNDNWDIVMFQSFEPLNNLLSDILEKKN